MKNTFITPLTKFPSTKIDFKGEVDHQALGDEIQRILASEHIRIIKTDVTNVVNQINFDLKETALIHRQFLQRLDDTKDIWGFTSRMRKCTKVNSFKDLIAKDLQRRKDLKVDVNKDWKYGRLVRHFWSHPTKILSKKLAGDYHVVNRFYGEKLDLDIDLIPNKIHVMYGKKPAEGISTKYRYISILGTGFPLHSEDAKFGSINFNHGPSVKYWLFIKPGKENRLKLNKALLKSNIDPREAFLKRMMIHPRYLEKHGIAYVHGLHHPGEMMVIPSSWPHQGINLGVCAADSINVIGDDWYKTLYRTCSKFDKRFHSIDERVLNRVTEMNELPSKCGFCSKKLQYKTNPDERACKLCNFCFSEVDPKSFWNCSAKNCSVYCTKCVPLPLPKKHRFRIVLKRKRKRKPDKSSQCSLPPPPPKRQKKGSVCLKGHDLAQTPIGKLLTKKCLRCEKPFEKEGHQCVQCRSALCTKCNQIISVFVEKNILPRAETLDRWDKMFQNRRYLASLNRRCFNWTRNRALAAAQTGIQKVSTM